MDNIESSEVSEEEFSELMKGKDLIFSNRVNVKSGEMFIDRDIDI